MCDLSDRRQLDFINLMAYDLHGPWERVTGHHSGLYAHSDESGPQRFLNTVGDVVFFLCNVIDNYFEVEPALSTALFTSYFFAKSQATVFFCQTQNSMGLRFLCARACVRACTCMRVCLLQIISSKPFNVFFLIATWPISLCCFAVSRVILHCLFDYCFHAGRSPKQRWSPAFKKTNENIH